MPKRITGRYERTTVGGEEVAAFIPLAPPPADLDIRSEQALRRFEHALRRFE